MPRLLLPLMLVFVLTLSSGVARADAYDTGHFFKNMGYTGLFLENGERDGHEGSGVTAYAEIMMLGLVSQLGHNAGFEMSAELGWAGYRDEGEADQNARGPFHMDLAVGFPIGLVEFGDEKGPFSLRLQVAPGMGASVLHAYAYLRGRLTLLFPGDFALDASYRWTPSRGSYAWEANTGLSGAKLRLALRGEVGPVEAVVFAELDQAKTEKITIGHLHPVERAVYQNLLRLGVGWAF